MELGRLKLPPLEPIINLQENRLEALEVCWKRQGRQNASRTPDLVVAEFLELLFASLDEVDAEYYTKLAFEVPASCWLVPGFIEHLQNRLETYSSDQHPLIFFIHESQFESLALRQELLPFLTHLGIEVWVDDYLSRQPMGLDLLSNLDISGIRISAKTGLCSTAEAASEGFVFGLAALVQRLRKQLLVASLDREDLLDRLQPILDVCWVQGALVKTKATRPALDLSNSQS